MNVYDSEVRCDRCGTWGAYTDLYKEAYCSYCLKYLELESTLNAVKLNCLLWRQEGSANRTAPLRLSRVCELLKMPPMHAEGEDHA